MISDDTAVTVESTRGGCLVEMPGMRVAFRPDGSRWQCAGTVRRGVMDDGGNYCVGYGHHPVNVAASRLRLLMAELAKIDYAFRSPRRAISDRPGAVGIGRRREFCT